MSVKVQKKKKDMSVVGHICQDLTVLLVEGVAAQEVDLVVGVKYTSSNGCLVLLLNI